MNYLIFLIQKNMHQLQAGQDYRLVQSIPQSFMEHWWDQSRWFNINSLPENMRKLFTEVNWWAMRTLELPVWVAEELKEKNQDLNLTQVLTQLGVTWHEAVTDYLPLKISELKKKWVLYIASVNDFWDINIQSIDEHFNPGDGTISRIWLRGQKDHPYFLLYWNK